MFKNRITACIFTQNPDRDTIFKKFEEFFFSGYSNRTTDWVILRTDNKILRYSELSDRNWNGTLALWQIFASSFIQYNVDVKYELAAKEIVIDMYNVYSSICIIINFNV